MAKTTQMYMVRRGRRYLIERTADGTFKKWVAVGNAKKKSIVKKGKKAKK